MPAFGQPDEPDIGDQAKLQSEPPLLARLAVLRVLRGLVGRGLEVCVAEAAAPATTDDGGLPGHDQVGDEGAGFVVVDGRPRWHVEDHVLPGRTVAALAFAPAARGRPEMVLVAKITQRGLAGVHPQMNGAAATAVSAVWATPRNVSLLAKRRGSVTARAGADPDLHAIEKHCLDCRMGPG